MGGIITALIAVIVLSLLGEIIREEAIERLQHNPTYRNAAITITIFTTPAIAIPVLVNTGLYAELIIGIYVGLVVVTSIGYAFFEKDDDRPDINFHGAKPD